MASVDVKLVWGATGLWAATPELTETWIQLMQDLKITDIDTAQNYGKSEQLLGQVGAPSRFLVDTKVSESMGPTVTAGDVVVKSGKESLEKLRAKSVSLLSWLLPSAVLDDANPPSVGERVLSAFPRASLPA